MKNHKSLQLLALLCSSASIGSAGAATALIDFGTNNTPSYNSAAMTAGDTGVIALTDTASAATGWTVNVLETGTGGGGNAGAGANVSVFPAALAGFETTALQDSIFANQGAGTAPSMVLTFAGLNSSATYDLLLYGSRNNAQGLDQIWSLTQGGTGADVTHFSEDNQTVFVDWPSISPNGSGIIEVTLRAGADNVGALALNFGSITETIPEPSTLTFLGLTAISLFARRRR